MQQPLYASMNWDNTRINAFLARVYGWMFVGLLVTALVAMAISPKTVEAHLARVYRKLGIRSRAELGAAVAAGNLPEH